LLYIKLIKYTTAKIIKPIANAGNNGKAIKIIKPINNRYLTTFNNSNTILKNMFFLLNYG